MNYIAKNTQYNRELNILDRQVVLLEKKNGFAYFIIKLDTRNVLAQCNANTFDSQFEVDLVTEADIKVLASYENIKKTDFKQYPKEIKKEINKTF